MLTKTAMAINTEWMVESVVFLINDRTMVPIIAEKYLSKGGTTEEWNKIKSQNKKILLTKSSNSGKITSFETGRSVGAKAKTYSVKLPGSRQHTKLAEGQVIEGKAFAGKGTGREIRDRFILEANYKIPAAEWQKVSGKGKVIIDGQERMAELHWYEADGQRFEIKVKRFLE